MHRACPEGSKTQFVCISNSYKTEERTSASLSGISPRSESSTRPFSVKFPGGTGELANSHTAMNPISSLASPISLENRASRQLTELSPLRHVACLEDDMLPRSVLVVDDNHLVCWGLSRSLADQDFLVRTVGTGADAISHVQADHYGLVFLDVRLPDATGSGGCRGS